MLYKTPLLSGVLFHDDAHFLAIDQPITRLQRQNLLMLSVANDDEVSQVVKMVDAQIQCSFRARCAIKSIEEMKPVAMNRAFMSVGRCSAQTGKSSPRLSVVSVVFTFFDSH